VISMYKKYVLRLTDQERRQLETLVRRGRAHARKVLYARILLKADAEGPDGWTATRGSPRLWRFAPPRWRERGDAFAKIGSRWR
jgi:hypothetical protein